MTDLKPCPFDGSQPHIFSDDENGTGTLNWCVSSIVCSTKWHFKREDAITAWNTRTQPAVDVDGLAERIFRDCLRVTKGVTKFNSGLLKRILLQALTSTQGWLPIDSAPRVEAQRIEVLVPLLNTPDAPLTIVEAYWDVPNFGPSEEGWWVDYFNGDAFADWQQPRYYRPLTTRPQPPKDTEQ